MGVQVFNQSGNRPVAVPDLIHPVLCPEASSQKAEGAGTQWDPRIYSKGGNKGNGGGR